MTRIKLRRSSTGKDTLVSISEIWSDELDPAWSTKHAAPRPDQCASGARLISKRLQRERKTIAAMVLCYCQNHHGAQRDPCPSCRGLLDYATLRLERCRFGEHKPTCANCPVHCYQARRREEVRIVMRYAGPRMLWTHPVLAVRHILDGYRKAPRSQT